MRRTAGSGSSFSRGEYPTPAGTPYGSSQNEGQVPHKRPTNGTPSLETWASRLWPTAATTDTSSSGRHTTTMGVMHPGTSLTDAIREWATPNATDSESAGGPRQKSLTRDMREWATPVVPNGGRTLSDEDVAAKGATAKGKVQVDLANQIRVWSTPAARDWKGEDFEREGGPSLPAQVMRKAGEDGSPRAVLNPRFVEALMGFPPGWTSFAPSETPSSLPKPRQPSESSSAGVEPRKLDDVGVHRFPAVPVGREDDPRPGGR